MSTSRETSGIQGSGSGARCRDRTSDIRLVRASPNPQANKNNHLSLSNRITTGRFGRHLRTSGGTRFPATQEAHGRPDHHGESLAALLGRLRLHIVRRAAVIGMALWLSVAQATHFDIPAGDAARMLNLWSEQSSLQILFDFMTLHGMPTQPVRCECAAATAIRQMLIGTGMTPNPENERTWSVTGIPLCKPWMGASAPLPPCIQTQQKVASL